MGDLFKSLVWEAMAKAALKRLLASLPAWIGGGPIGFVVSWVFNKIADRIYSELDKLVVTQGIYLRNQAQQLAFDRAGLALQIVSDTYGPESEQFKKERENAKRRLADLVSFT
jgi:hypothetical protein